LQYTPKKGIPGTLTKLEVGLSDDIRRAAEDGLELEVIANLLVYWPVMDLALHAAIHSLAHRTARVGGWSAVGNTIWGSIVIHCRRIADKTLKRVVAGLSRTRSCRYLYHRYTMRRR
jgi:hypothetical protein